MLSIRWARSNDQQIDFCEECGSVCDSVCRIEALRNQALTQAPLSGWRLV